MASTIDDQLIAMAGMTQALQLIQTFAYEGRVADQQAMDASIGSLFAFDAPDTPSIYGGLPGVRFGMRRLTELLAGNSREPRDLELTRYVVTLFAVTKAFRRDEEMAARLFGRLEELKPAFDQHGADPGMLSDLNNLYRQTLSHLPQKFVINGEKHHLEDMQISSSVRALLLAGVRATILFDQVGGRRWRLLFMRKRYVESARLLLQRM
ncbi:lysogenization protein HflD [Guyparkeria sp.]|uniref:lysogenization protein HflD n=1 Tax=Guyparkeria sp. TaxID=2035736 RepID=UPI0035698DD7